MDHHREMQEPPQEEENPLPEESTMPVSREETGEKEEPEEEKVQWDGSEAELVADDDAEEYEEQNTGIKLSYILRPEEIFLCLKESGVCRTTGKRAAAESVILGILALVFGFSYVTKHDGNALVFAVICLLLIPIIWLVPHFGLKRQARSLADGKEIELEIYPDVIEVGAGESSWKIPMDGTCECAQFSNLFVFTLSGGQRLILPMRCVEPAVMPEIHAIILAGTRKRD